jgi:type I restriction enzyme S subunit
VNYNKRSFGLGVKVLSVSNFQDYTRPRYAELKQINPDGIVTPRNILRDGDIVFVRTNGNRELIGRSLFVEKPPEEVTHSAFTIRLRFTAGNVFPKFFAYYLRTPAIRQELTAYGGGTNISYLTQDILSALEVPFPPFSTQRKIAAVLGAYDDLIDNNLRRIKILEEMAQNLYSEWFVKFRFPGHQQARFTDSPIGPIPEGWLGSFPDFVDFKEGPGLRKWQYRSEGLPFLNIRTLVHNDIDLSKVQYLDKNEVEDKYQHFLLAEYDHVVSSSGTLGRIVTIQKQHLPLMLNTSIIRMRPRTIRVGRWQLKHFLNSDYFQNQILSFAIGAAQPNFGPIHLKQMLIVAPSDEIGVLYEETVEPLEEMIGVLVRKNTILRRTRDLLPPKLISGEVDIARRVTNV